MSIQEILKILTDSGIEPNEANTEVKMLLEHFANYGVKDIVMGNKLTDEKLRIVKEKAELRAKTRQPIQHIIGFADFMGEKLQIFGLKLKLGLQKFQTVCVVFVSIHWQI